MDRSRGQAERGNTDWAFRDGRNGYIDSTTSNATAKLFETHHNHGINFEKYFDIPIDISEEGIPQMFNFCDCEVHESLLQNLKRFGYDKPTPVQQYAIPVSLLRRDLMACAQTGSGKTAAYLYPLVAKMLQDGPPPPVNQRSSRPVALIMAPTRELSVQIYEEGLKFTYMTGIRVNVVYGGAPIGDQERKLLEGSDVIIATPGRLIDFIEKRVINLYIVRYLILDEADRMLDMGFEPQIIKILEAIKKADRETIMCSATFPADIQNIARKYLNNFVKLSVGRVGSTTENITQKIMLVRHREKEDFLVSLLAELKGQILLFVERKATANDLNSFLIKQGVKCSCIHGDRVQIERERALNDFKSQKINILIATDVASRGLDIPNVSYVVIFDLPNCIESYVHRIGRTGRIGNTGIAITLVEDRPTPVLQDLIKILNECSQEVPQWLRALNSGEMMDNSWYNIPKIIAQRGPSQGYEAYPRQGYNQGSGQEYNRDYSQGYNKEENQGYNRGYNQGYNRGGHNQDFNKGYNQDYNRGYNQEYNRGDDRGSGQSNNRYQRDQGFSERGYSGGYSNQSNNVNYNRKDDYQSEHYDRKQYNSGQGNFEPHRGRGNYRPDSGYGRGYNDRNEGGGNYGGSSGYGRGYNDRNEGGGNYGGSSGYGRGYNDRNEGGGNYRGSSGYNRGYSDRNEGGGNYDRGRGGYRGRNNPGYRDSGYRDRQDSSWNSSQKIEESDWLSAPENKGQVKPKPEASKPTYDDQDPWGAGPDKSSLDKGVKSQNIEEDPWGGSQSNNINKPQQEEDLWGGSQGKIQNKPQLAVDPWDNPPVKKEQNEEDDPWA